MDFWESYDPDEICKNGFCIIGSEKLPMQAICFLCGSGGLENLLHCSSCCEPYHPFCLEQVPYEMWSISSRLNWLCPRCTVCRACGQTDRQKVNCQKCHKDYHPECFNAKWRTNEIPSVSIRKISFYFFSTKFFLSNVIILFVFIVQLDFF